MHRTWLALFLLVSIGARANDAAASDASWIERMRANVGLRTAPVIGTLDRVATHVKSLPSERGSHALAAETGADGHVRLVNRAGETFSAATPDELTRALATLLPASPAGPAGTNTPPLTIHVTEASVFQNSQALGRFPRSARLSASIGDQYWPLRRSGRGEDLRLYAEVAPRVLVALTSRADFDEALTQLGTRVRNRMVRILALEPGSTTPLAPRAPLAKSQAGPPVEAVDPDHLRNAFGALREQLAVVSGRIDGERLVYQGSSGPERSLLLRDLTSAAGDHDADLLVLASGWARQPGTRNWLWVKSDIAGLDAGLRSGTFADLLALLAGEGNRMLVGLARDGGDRVRLDVRAAPVSGSANPLAEALSDLVTGVTGTATPTAIAAHFKSEARRRELSLRLIPRIPALMQLGYLVLLALGFPGWLVARRWWRRIWPAESESEYGSAFGWWAARAMRGLAFIVLFLPVAGLFATVSQLAHLLGGYRRETAPTSDAGKAAS